LKTGSDPAVLNHPLLSQPICSAVQIALVDLLASWGIRPDSVTGHSSGEIAAAYAFGALSMEDAMAVAYYRGVVASTLASDDTPCPGAMLAVGMSPDETKQYINQLKTGKAVIACLNSPSSVTVSGDAAAIDELQNILHDRFFIRRLAVKVAYHSHHMEPVADEYTKLIAHITHGHNNVMTNDNPQGHVSFFSSVTGAEVEASDLGPQYWVRNLVSPVRFTDALRALCFGTGSKGGMNDGKRARRSGTARKARINMLVEIGPHAALSGPIKQTIENDTRLKAAEILYTSVLIRKSHAVTTALNTAATLACAGHSVTFQAINNPSPSRPVRVLVDLPPYAWNHTRSYWAEPRLSKAFRKRKYPRTDLLGAPDTSSCPFEPRWRNIVRLSELPWLQDHRIQSSIVYPAAAYIAMVIEAMLQVTSEAAESESRGFVLLEDVSIKSALIIPEHSAVEMLTSFRPWDSNPQSEPKYEFHIYSATDDNKWTEHCTGLVGFRHVADEMDTPLAGADPELSALNVNQFYERLSSIGLEYGPYFSNISSAQFANNMCTAKVSVPDTAAVMPMGFEYPCIIHPCTLDSIIQTVFAGMDVISNPAVPVHIDQISVSRSITSTAGSELDIRTLIHRRRKDAITASISATEPGGSAGIAIKNLRCKRLDVDRPAGSIKAQNRIAYDLEWKIDPDFLLHDGLSKLFKRKSAPAGRSESDGLLDACALHYIRRCVDEVNQLHGNVNLHRAQLKYFRQVVQNHRQTDITEADFTAARNSGPQGALLAVMGEGLLNTLNRDTSPEHVEASTAWEDYWKFVHEDPINDDLMEYLDLVCHKNPMITILELEAGAGGAFQRFLKRYPEGSLPCSRYVATHPSSSFVERWAPTYSKLGPVLEFKQLDIEEDSDISKQRFDVVIGLSGLYTVNSKHVALRNIHTLLKEDGKLLMIDPVSNSTPTNVVIFSNYPGQWSKGHFGHLESDWKAALVRAQFPPRRIHLNRSGDSLMLVAQKQTETATGSADILIIADGHSAVCLVRLQELFLSSSSTVEVTDLRQAEPAGKLTIVLSDLTHSVLAQPDEKTWNITKDIFLKSHGSLWVTRGGAPSPTNPDTGLVTGFARTARSESGVQTIVTLDLDGRKPLCEEMAAQVIYDLVQHRFLRKSSNVDTEYSERNGLLLIPRVVENTDLNDALGFRNSQASHIEPFHQPGRPRRAVLDNHDTLRVLFEEISQTTPLADCDVRIEVHAASVSKSSLDMVDGSAKNELLLIDACSGLVVATGMGVHGLSPGDRVLCLASGPLESVYQDKMTAFHKIPSEIGMEAAVALPTAYCAALHVVRNIAHIRPGQKVLIYSTATAFAQAVIHICRRLKAQVFAIVNTAAEKSILLSASLIQNEKCILDDSDFTPRDVSAFIKCEVDVVIDFANSRDQHLTDLVRPFGHFIQVQNQIFEGGSRRQMPRLREDISFTSFDFDHFRRRRPDIIEDIFPRLGNLLQDGSLHVPPLPAYPISKASEALQKLESDSGSESIIITATSKDTVQVIHRSDSGLLRPDASYMLVGGLGGIGRAIALWMADHGTKTLVLVSRSGLLDKNAMSTVEMLEREGVEAIVRACDVANSDQISSMISELSRSRPPIRGVVQAAMVLKVCLIDVNKKKGQLTITGHSYREDDSRELRIRPQTQVQRHLEPAPLSAIRLGLVHHVVFHQRNNRQCYPGCLRRGLNLHGYIRRLPTVPRPTRCVPGSGGDHRLRVPI
jgi:NADPH:quinone reductase-like Zn-dependent oxidoreductase/SAM-dependent methyltransferase